MLVWSRNYIFIVQLQSFSDKNGLSCLEKKKKNECQKESFFNNTAFILTTITHRQCLLFENAMIFLFCS